MKKLRLLIILILCAGNVRPAIPLPPAPAFNALITSLDQMDALLAEERSYWQQFVVDSGVFGWAIGVGVVFGLTHYGGRFITSGLGFSESKSKLSTSSALSKLRGDSSSVDFWVPTPVRKLGQFGSELAKKTTNKGISFLKTSTKRVATWFLQSARAHPELVMKFALGGLGLVALWWRSQRYESQLAMLVAELRKVYSGKEGIEKSCRKYENLTPKNQREKVNTLMQIHVVTQFGSKPILEVLTEIKGGFDSLAQQAQSDIISRLFNSRVPARCQAFHAAIAEIIRSVTSLPSS